MIFKSTKLFGIATVVTVVFLLAPKTLAVGDDHQSSTQTRMQGRCPSLDLALGGVPCVLFARRNSTPIVQLRYIVLPSEAVTMNVREL